MKKAATVLIVTLCFCSTLAERALAEQQPRRLTGMYRGAGPRQDSLLWGRIGRDLSFAPRWQTGTSVKSMADTRCNDDGFTRQWIPRICSDGFSNVVACWADERHGHSAIYGQRFDSLCTPIGCDFKVCDDLTSWGRYSSSIAASQSGDFVVVFEDHRNGNFDVYGQRYNSVGEAQGGNFKINENTGDDGEYVGQVAMDAVGNFVVVWSRRQPNLDVCGQRYSSGGLPLGGNFVINDVVEHDQDTPSVGMDSAGNFMVVWMDCRNWDTWGWDIYGQLYHASGTPQAGNFRVNDDLGDHRQFSPAIAMNQAGECIVVWEDHRNSEWQIFAQRYNASGEPVGANFRINTESDAFDPATGMDQYGNFVVAWEDYQNSYVNIFAQRYNYLNEPQGSNFKVHDDMGDRGHYFPSVAITPSGDFYIAWSDSRPDNEYFVNSNIWCQRYDACGEPLGNNVRLNSENPDHLQSEPSISVDTMGSFVLAWTDHRNEGLSPSDDTDIFGLVHERPYHQELRNERVNQDEIAWGHQQNSPSCAGYGSKEVVTAWSDLRDLDWDIYAVRGPYGSEYKVNEDISDGNWNPSIAADDSGNFLVVWTDARNGYPKFDIYAQRFNSVDEPQGGNFRVNEEPLWCHQDWSSVDMNGGGDFVVVWEDWRLGSIPYVYGQRFNDAGEPQGPNFKVNDQGVASGSHYYPDVAVDDFGNFVVAWQRYSDIYAQMYDYSGQRIGGNFLVNDQAALDEAPPSVPSSLSPSQLVTEDCLYSSPRLGIDIDGNGNFVVAWSDYRNGDGDIYAQRYHFTGAVWGDNYRVNTDPGSASQSTPDLAINDTCVYYTWLDDRAVEYDYVDVYSKVEYWSPRYLPGDASGDDIVNVGDIVYLIGYLYQGGAPPAPLNAGDPNADCSINVGDVVYLQTYLYKGGSPPKPGCVE